METNAFDLVPTFAIKVTGRPVSELFDKWPDLLLLPEIKEAHEKGLMESFSRVGDFWRMELKDGTVISF